MINPRLSSVVAVVIAFATGCGRPAASGATAPTAAPSSSATHAHHGARHDAHAPGDGAPDRGPLVHRFEHAEEWVSRFDDKARDEWQMPAAVIGAMGIKPGMTVADVGAGTGYFEPWLSRAVGAKGTVIALDIEPDMIRYLRERAAREQLSNVRADVVATDDPKLAKSSVDRILIVDTWHHVPERRTYAKKLYDGLRSGGELYVVDFTLEAKNGPPAHHRLAPERVVEELQAAGFSARAIQEPLPEQYIVVGQRP